MARQRRPREESLSTLFLRVNRFYLDEQTGNFKDERGGQYSAKVASQPRVAAEAPYDTFNPNSLLGQVQRHITPDIEGYVVGDSINVNEVAVVYPILLLKEVRPLFERPRRAR